MLSGKKQKSYLEKFSNSALPVCAGFKIDEQTKKKVEEACAKSRAEQECVILPPREGSEDAYEQQVKAFEHSFMKGFVGDMADYIEDLVDQEM
jgi:hypothetical protein